MRRGEPDDRLPAPPSDGSLTPMRRSELHDLVASRLEAVAQRYTTARRALVDVLADAAAPITTAAIAERNRSLTTSSTYRNLAVLEEAGIVRRLVTSAEHASFELAEDLTEHHHHMICSSCGSVRDVTLPEALERELDRALARLAKRNDFAVREHRLDLVGVCGSCN
jgi:Fur family ferric uptake transcriptional regulator